MAKTGGSDRFPKLWAAADQLLRDAGAGFSDALLVRLICSDCPFFKEGEDEELECGAFRLLRHLLRAGVVTVPAIVAAACPDDEP